MKIGYASDIHIEIGGQREITLTEPVDVLVLAGDIGKGANAVKYASGFLDKARHVVQVAGNHEHYKGEISSTLRKMREEAQNYDGLHFLENESVEIDGLWFHGTTAWTDFSYGGVTPALNMFDAESAMNDYKKIKFISRGAYRKLKPQDLLPINSAAKSFIFGAVEKTGRDNSVVVTHHAPCHLSICEKYKGDRLNHCYVNQWGNDIAYNGPKLWFHGHIHTESDYEVGDTRILCNPIDYPGYRSDTEIKIIEI